MSLASGIKLNDHALNEYNRLQRPGTGDKEILRYIIFKIEDPEIVIDRQENRQVKGERDPTEVYDFGSKPVLMFWNPEDAAVRDRMLYAASFDAIKKKFNGIGACIQTSDMEDLELNVIQQKIDTKSLK
ncbi:hypothetical protein KUTeg_014073 [Tegillarca granosa]|uniref:ADF-H domain-containing protein n=1 Tax=Tegillarca granosa TaxID=220873 RepID=A0ABQ9EVK2_TEGGR|nr:hypothetical protein KUTeg_014073 [Tegillarca granosa]